MRQRHDPWKWPVCIGLAVSVLLSGVFLVPRSWIEFFFSPLTFPAAEADSRPAAWLTLIPPPEIEVAMQPPLREDPEPPGPVTELPEYVDPAWWTEGWRVRTVEAARTVARTTAEDSVQVLMARLGVPGDIISRVNPDSLLASRLLLMRREDSFAFDELKPYFTAVSRSRAYADIMSRAADMYDEFLQSEIIVPD